MEFDQHEIMEAIKILANRRCLSGHVTDVKLLRKDGKEPKGLTARVDVTIEEGKPNR